MGKTVSDEVLQLCVDTVAECHGNKEKAARLLKVPSPTLKHRLRLAELRGLTALTVARTEDNGPLLNIIDGLRSELDLARAEASKVNRPHYTIRQDNVSQSETIRVLVMGDAHDDPKIPDKSRFYWAGKYCAEHKHDVMLSIGDFLNMNSLCFHVPDETYHGKAKPTYMADIESGKKALDAINSGLGNWKPEKHITVGNHENRLYRQEDKTPASWGMYQSLFDEIVSGAGFTYSPYGAPHRIGGVVFSHIPLTIMGKPSSGRHLNAIGNDSIEDSVYGHSHRARSVSFPKLFAKSVTVVDAGCYLPHGYKCEESFAEHTPGDWSYGLTDLRIKNKRIVDYSFVSVLSLEERYGNKN